MFNILRALVKKFGNHDGDYAWINFGWFELFYDYHWSSQMEFLTLSYRENIIFDIRKEKR